MDTEMKLAIMQNTYAAALAEAINTYERMKVLDYVVEKKKERLTQTAAAMNAQLGVENAEDVFVQMADVFGCANWEVTKTDNGFTATATACKLCALCKKMGGANPCNGWCLNPMQSMIAATDKRAQFIIKETQMDGNGCRVEVVVR